MGVFIGICGVLIGCILNAICLEFSVKSDPGCGTLITFAQFLFIALEGFVVTTKFGTSKRRIPIKNYLVVVIVFFVCNVCNNYAFDFNISMPLHMIFRSGSLIANMIMGIIILKKNYPISKYLSVLLITFGVIICTIITGKNLEIKKKPDLLNGKMDEDEINKDEGFLRWLLGIALLVFALFISALLGIFQELTFKKYGKHPYEALFYTHMLPIPIFFIFYKNLLEHYNIMMSSELMNIPVLNVEMPCMLVYLIGNMVTQYLCISSVYYLTTEATSLTVTLVITLRKFLSLLLSIIYFGNQFTLWHSFGTALVFIGTLIFTEVPTKLLGKSKVKKS